MDNMDKIVKEVFVYINKSTILKIITVVFALYFIFKLGKSLGEFIYYISH